MRIAPRQNWIKALLAYGTVVCGIGALLPV